jgi:hypothetical protein
MSGLIKTINFLLLSLSTLVIISHAVEGNVYKLNGSNFDTFANDHKQFLVEFYAPGKYHISLIIKTKVVRIVISLHLSIRKQPIF